jgi:hypothetical protein
MVTPRIEPGRVRSSAGRRPDDALGSAPWAGASIARTGDETLNLVFSRWTVPSPYPSAPADGLYEAIAWIGLDGVGGNVLQAGTGQLAQVTNGQRAVNCYAWFEWYPGFQQVISSDDFPLNPGELVSCLLCAPTPTSAIFAIANLSTGIATSVGLQAPPGVALQGENAQWIVESPLAGLLRTERVDVRPGALRAFAALLAPDKRTLSGARRSHSRVPSLPREVPQRERAPPANRGADAMRATSNLR